MQHLKLDTHNRCHAPQAARARWASVELSGLCSASSSRRVGKQSELNLLQKLTKQQCGAQRQHNVSSHTFTHNTHIQLPQISWLSSQTLVQFTVLTIELPAQKALNKYLLCSAGIFQHKAQHTRTHTHVDVHTTTRKKYSKYQIISIFR